METLTTWASAGAELGVRLVVVRLIVVRLVVVRLVVVVLQLEAQ